jgi:hypothetical protein
VSVFFWSEMVTGIVADGELADGDELLEPLLVEVATGLTPMILPLTVLPSGSSTVTGSWSTASLCLVASRSTVTTRLVDVVLRMAEALAPLLALSALVPEEDEPLPLDAAPVEDEPPPPPVLRTAPVDPEVPVEPFPAVPEVLADMSSDWSSLFCVSRSFTMASSALLEGVPDSGEVAPGVVVVVGEVVVAGAGVVVVGVVGVGHGVVVVVVLVVAGAPGHAGVSASDVLAGLPVAVAALVVVRSTNSAWGWPAIGS